nr:hypothetical protein [Streptomyces antimycoticus]
MEMAARIAARVSKVVIEESGRDVDVAALWRAPAEVAPRAALSGAAPTVVSLVPEDDVTAETALRGALAPRYNTVRQFLSLLASRRRWTRSPVAGGSLPVAYANAELPEGAVVRGAYVVRAGTALPRRAATSSPRPHTAGPTRAPASWRRSASRYS